MILIETCPKCGHDLRDEVICTMPPIPRKVCYSCGWIWEGEPEQVMRVPFGGNSYNDTETITLKNNGSYSTTTTLNDLNLIYADNAITKDNVISLNDLNGINVTDYAFTQSACVSCPNNIKNGGNGICHCTLGQVQFT